MIITTPLVQIITKVTIRVIQIKTSIHEMINVHTAEMVVTNKIVQITVQIIALMQIIKLNIHLINNL